MPDLRAEVPHWVTLQYAAGHKRANHAWHPIGPLLRAGKEVIKLPQTTPLRCRPQPLPDLAPFDGLPFVPQPSSWKPDGQTLTIGGFPGNDPALAAVAALAARLGLTFVGVHPVSFANADLPPDAYTCASRPKAPACRHHP